jgi:mitochondrial import receptor subunit TOM40
MLLAGLNYFQSLTTSLSAGGEFFWLGGQLRSGLGLALRHSGEQHIATMQVATTGILSAQYAHKVTDKVRSMLALVCASQIRL